MKRSTSSGEQTRWKNVRFQRCRRKLVNIVARGLKKAKTFAKLKLIKTLKTSRQALASEPDNSDRDTEIQKLEQRVEALKALDHRALATAFINKITARRKSKSRRDAEAATAATDADAHTLSGAHAVALMKTKQFRDAAMEAKKLWNQEIKRKQCRFNGRPKPKDEDASQPRRVGEAKHHPPGDTKPLSDRQQRRSRRAQLWKQRRHQHALQKDLGQSVFIESLSAATSVASTITNHRAKYSKAKAKAKGKGKPKHESGKAAKRARANTKKPSSSKRARSNKKATTEADPSSHPSWAASQKQKEQMKNAFTSFKGKKIVFE